MITTRGNQRTYQFDFSNENLSVYRITINKLSLMRSLPDPAVYILFDQQGQVVYVGKSIRPKRRIQTHFRSAVFQFTHFVILGCDERDMQSIETYLIELYKPTHNTEKNPIYQQQLREKRRLAGLMGVSKRFQTNYIN